MQVKMEQLEPDMGQQTVGDSTVIAHQNMHWKKCMKPPANRSNCQHLLDHRKSKRVPENTYFCFIDYAKAFDCVDHNKLWETLQEMGIPDTLPASCQTCMQVKKQQLESDMEQQTGSKLGKEYVKTVYCHPAYFTSMQSTLCEMPGCRECCSP